MQQIHWSKSDVDRNALQREVFPRLRKLCEQNNARFQAIDLRWACATRSA